MVWIVNFESSQVLERCLVSVVGAGVDEIYVLDNGSSADEVEAVRALAIRVGVTDLFLSETNLGFGEGNNEISRRVESRPGDVVWMLNPDTIVEKDAPRRLQEVLDNGLADIVSPVILAERDGITRLWFSGGSVDLSSGRVTDSQLGRSELSLISAPPLLSSEFISGAAMMLRREVWDRLGGFRDDFFLYWEDVDFSLRASRAKLVLRVSTEARITHLEGHSSRGNARRRANAYYYMSRNRILTCRKPGSRGLGLVFGAGGTAVMELCAYAVIREGSGGLARLFAIIRGSVDAMRSIGTAVAANSGQEGGVTG